MNDSTLFAVRFKRRQMFETTTTKNAHKNPLKFQLIDQHAFHFGPAGLTIYYKLQTMCAMQRQ